MTKPGPTDVSVHGDYFDRDTRSLLGMCDLAEVKASLQIVDTFNGGNLEMSYRESFATDSIPSIVIGNKKQVKDNNTNKLFQFLLENQARIKIRLYSSD
eukprot:CAMPEP_0170464824 /NCGR_PEP_ID=MMETSP0123-20130129/9393_1 /TAXON_ID=182087 /ORGANISM="Favella ehrenbergii, Strain Fehren 1" /LENGTH=98 /DNA_ID=CAMNT_0010730557 /DNA_START=97 /DNA_END=393 /DNA_ORIENTATION=-